MHIRQENAPLVLHMHDAKLMSQGAKPNCFEMHNRPCMSIHTFADP